MSGRAQLHATGGRLRRVAAPRLLHDGGWIFGDFPARGRLVRDPAVQSVAAAVVVNDTAPPEARDPVVIDQAMDGAPDNTICEEVRRPIENPVVGRK